MASPQGRLPQTFTSSRSSERLYRQNLLCGQRPVALSPEQPTPPPGASLLAELVREVSGLCGSPWGCNTFPCTHTHPGWGLEDGGEFCREGHPSGTLRRWGQRQLEGFIPDCHPRWGELQGLLGSGSSARSKMMVSSHTGPHPRGPPKAAGPVASQAGRTQDYVCTGGSGGAASVTPVQSPRSPQWHTAASLSAVRSSCREEDPDG